ncbi:MAG TPA: GNAT family N-acetyltransferase [Acidobacteriota bacterium]|nr:GNAT family N-acetyltransferase [Acidobacteriota bacterium]
MAEITLRKITRETLQAILDLHVSRRQEQFVASNAKSIAQAYFHEEAWFRAIYADDTPVGFVMLFEIPEKAQYWLWRFMIDVRYQGKGYGRRALELLIAHVKTRPNAKLLYLSHRWGEGDPGGFYRKMGFVYTGDHEDGELRMKLDLS